MATTQTADSAATTGPAAIGEAERRRGLRVLLASTFLTWGGFFVVVPLIAVHYVDQLGWTAASIGLVLAVRQFTQQGLTTLGGALADRLGAKGPICAGMLLRAAGFAAMATADTYPLLMLSAVVAAVGGALFEAPKAAAIAALTNASDRPRYYAQTGLAGGLGITLGTQLGALLLRADFALVCLVGAVTFFAIFWLVLALLPPIRVAQARQPALRGLGLALRDRPFMTFNALMAGYWFGWTQYSLALPLAATAVAGTPDAVAWVYAVNAGTTLLLGYPLPRLAGRRLDPPATLVLGVVLTALGLGAVAAAPDTPAFLAAVFLFSVGAVLVRPSEQTVAADLADPAALGSYFGVAALALAVGGGLGNFAGGALYDLGQRLDRPALPWLLFAAVGLAAAAGLRATLVPAHAPPAERVVPEPEPRR